MSTQAQAPRRRNDQTRDREVEVRFVPLGSGLFLDRATGHVVVL